VTNEISIRNDRISRITITASNLSEDISLLASKDDELLFLVFNYIDYRPGENLVLQTFTFDTSDRSFSIDLDHKFAKGPKLIALIELDSSTSHKRISDLVQNHHLSLLHSFRLHDLEQIEEILDDDDLLGIKITDPMDRVIKFSGTWRMDRYEYQITLSSEQ